MHAVTLLLAASTLAVDYGWKTSDDGQLEYVIQIEPPLLEALKAGEVITSEIDPRVANVRRFRVRVGREPLPHDIPPSALSATSARPIPAADQTPEAAPDALVTGPDFGNATVEDREPPPLDHGLGEDESAGDDARQGGFSNAMDSPVVTAGNTANAEGPTANHAQLTAMGVGEPGAVDRTQQGQPAPQREASSPWGGPSADRAGEQGTGDPEPGQSASTPQIQQQAQVRVDVADAKFDEGPQPQPPDSPDGSPEVDPVSSAGPKTQVEGEKNAEAGRPWLPLTVTLLALFASIGLNVYLGWVMWDTYHRSQQLAARLHSL